jgi:predicted AlkP superfamily pyrophosphatase or phosphodiesterase
MIRLAMPRSVRYAFAALAFPVVASAADSTATPVARVSKHVVIVSIDGLRPDAIAAYGAKNLQRLMREGSYTLQAQTILPSKTLPSHTSMLTGVDVEDHGINWNSDQTDDHGHVDVPTIFALAKQAGYTTAAFFSKTKFHHLEVPASLDHVRSPQGGLLTSRFTWERTVGMVEDYLEHTADAPNLMFVHIGEPDYAGHLFGWMSQIYGVAVRQADQAIGEILDEANDRFGAGNFTIIVTADHGGHGRNHGSEDARDTTIPWIVWGQGVQQAAALPAVRTFDTAATALWMLGIDAPSAWVGKAVTSAFTRTLAAGSQ